MQLPEKSSSLITDPKSCCPTHAQVRNCAWGQIVWRTLCGVMALLFAAATFLQHNDPDMEVWIVAYSVPSLLCLAVAVYPRIVDKILWNILLVLHLSGCAVGAMYLVISSSTALTANGVNPFDTEIGRELGGLLLTTAWLSLLVFVSLKRFLRRRQERCANASNTQSSSTSRVTFGDRTFETSSV